MKAYVKARLLMLTVLIPTLVLAADNTRIAVLPLMNLTATPIAGDICTRAVQQELKHSKWSMVDSVELETYLRAKRIRNTTALSQEMLALLSTELSADYVLCGTVERYIRTSDVSEVAVNLRLIDPNRQIVVWSNSIDCLDRPAQTLLDLFTKGRQKSIENKAVQLLLKKFSPASVLAKNETGARVMVAPLSNESTTTNAGAIATAELVNVLVNRGYTVIDPGMTEYELFEHTRDHSPTPNLEVIRSMNPEINADWLVTGVISDLSTEANAEFQEPARVSIHLRLVSIKDGTIVESAVHERDGSHSIMPFGIATNLRAADLCSQSLQSAVSSLRVMDHDRRY